MFCVGDEALHPIYGKVVIERIKKIKIQEVMKAYLVMHVNGMEIMIPIDALGHVGIRKLSNKAAMDKTITILKDDLITLPGGNYNNTQKKNLEKIVSGDITLVAEVMKGLLNKSKDKKLSEVDKKHVRFAEQILLGEIMVSEHIGEKEAEKILNGYLHIAELM